MSDAPRPFNPLLGQGDERLPNLLGGSFGRRADESIQLDPGFGARLFIKKQEQILAGGSSRPTTGGGTSGGGAGCVDVASLLPCGKRAGHVEVGDELDLLDPVTLESRRGVVSYSQRKVAVRWQLVTRHGGLLVCSQTAQIPIDDGAGYASPPLLVGHSTVVLAEGEIFRDLIVGARCVGEGYVQHITCENACFLAGEFAGAYLLHHNAKRPTVGGGDAHR